MVPAPRTASNFRSIPMHLTQVAYGGCWKCPQLWQRCSSRTPRLAASQNGFVHSLGTGIGLVTLLQSLIRFLPLSPCGGGGGRSTVGKDHAARILTQLGHWAD